MMENIAEKLARISTDIYVIGVSKEIKELEELSAQLNDLAAEAAKLDWHTETPAEEGLYLCEEKPFHHMGGWFIGMWLKKAPEYHEKEFVKDGFYKLEFGSYKFVSPDVQAWKLIRTM
jgi:hypothetical protein